VLQQLCWSDKLLSDLSRIKRNPVSEESRIKRFGVIWKDIMSLCRRLMRESVSWTKEEWLRTLYHLRKGCY